MRAKVLVQHGFPEQTPLRLANSLADNPVDERVSHEFADWRIPLIARRWFIVNPATAYPGLPESPLYEHHRPIHTIRDSQAWDVLIDPHDRPDSHGEYVTLSRTSKPELLGIAAYLGIRNVLVVPPSAKVITNYIEHAVTVEMTRGGGRKEVNINVARLRHCLAHLAVSEALPLYDPMEFDYYNTVTEIPDYKARKLELDRFGRLEPFQPLPTEAAERLELDSSQNDFVVDYWNGINSSEGKYFGGVLARTTNPF
jgi:hypothetical protein